MTNWEAVTETGTVWRYSEGILTVKSHRTGMQVFKPWTLKTLDRNDPHTGPGGLRAWINDSPDLNGLPIVGKSIYAGSPDQWRLSTSVVKVVELQ